MDWLANISPVTVLIVSGILLAVILVLRYGVRDRSQGLITVEENLRTVLGVVVIVFLIIRPFIFQAYYIPSASMEPTLLEPHPDERGREVPGDRILADKLLYRLTNPKRGEIAIFMAPPQASPEPKEFVKRVIGVPGDTVEVVSTQPSLDGSKEEPGYIKLNGKKVREDYIREPMTYAMPPVHLGPNEYFMMGDNRNESLDSHVWGPLTRDRFIGRVEVIFWPFQRARVLHYWLMGLLVALILGWTFVQQLYRRLRPPTQGVEKPVSPAPAVPQPE